MNKPVGTKDAKSTATPKNGNVPTLDVSKYDSWSEEQIGFAPYWSPAEGKCFEGIVIARDERDPKFIRYLFENSSGIPLVCQRGPAKEAEDVMVAGGETFSISVYYQLKDLLDLYLESGLRPALFVRANKEVDTKTTGQTVWLFTAKVDPAKRPLIDAYRAKLLAEAAETKRLTAHNAE